MAGGVAWGEMLALPRHAAACVRADLSVVPPTPGVYAWFQDDAPIYAGRAVGRDGLRGRLRNHLGTGLDLSRSSFRRNVMEYLLSIPTSTSRLRPSALTVEQVAAVNEWVDGCEVTWRGCVADDEARALVRALLSEWMPSLSKR